ncbi:MAG: adenosine kinase [Alphaproteobacteria bacterium]|nr:adenosine kinase [Alphaproteobacteria bacterium]
MAASFDILGIGNAIVDVLQLSDDAALTRHGIAKGTMTLIDEYRAHQLTAVLGDASLVSGGSCANTIAGLASLGASCAFIGKVKTDTFGEAFADDLKGLGVTYETPMASDGPPTARCLIFVTPDGQRSMNTYLGASVELSDSDVDPALVQRAGIIYLEGYLWDPPAAKSAIRKAIGAAKDAGGKVAFTLSDPFCVGRWRDEFLALIKNDVDIFFANEHEILSLYEVDTFDEALQAVRASGKIAALTRSERGSVIVKGNEVHVIDAVPTTLVDTTGAGDLFASGFLFGLTRGASLDRCGRMGAHAAAHVIAHLGPRPRVSLKALFAEAGLL